MPPSATAETNVPTKNNAPADTNTPTKTTSLAPITITLILLAAILALALLLRLAGVARPEPINYHPDDWVIARPTLAIANDGPKLVEDIHYKWPARALIYPLGLTLYALKSWCGPYTYPTILIIQRILSAIAGTAAVLVAFLLMRKMISTRAALIAATLLAVAHLPVQQSHFGTVTATVSLIILLIMLLSYDLFDLPTQQPRRLKILRCSILGLILGLGLAAKWTVLLAAIPLTAAILLPVPTAVQRHNLSRLVTINLLRIVIIIVATAAGFLAGMPDIIANHDRAWSDLTYEAEHHQTGHYGTVLTEDRTPAAKLTRTFTMMRRSTGIYLLIAGIIATVYCLARRNRPHLFLLWTIILWLGMLFRNAVAMQRHHLVPATLMLLIIAAALESFLRSPRPAIRWCTRGLCALLLITGALYTLICISPFWRPESRNQCAQWLIANAPPGSGVAAAPATPLWSRPQWIMPQLTKTFARTAQPDRPQFIIASDRSLKIFTRHPPSRPIVPKEWYPSSVPSRRTLLLYDAMNRGGSRNLVLVKEFACKPSFIGLDLRFFFEAPNQDTSFANHAVKVFRLQ